MTNLIAVSQVLYALLALVSPCNVGRLRCLEEFVAKYPALHEYMLTVWV
jgi:hypothetical protein